MMKQVYLILVALMLLCLAPMPYGYFQLVWFVAMVPLWNLLPKRLILVPSRKAHCSRINVGILREQGFDVLRECVRGVDAVEPVGDIAEMGVELVGGELPIGYPSIRKAAGETRVDNYNSIPKTSMVGTDITNDSNTAQPTAHILKLWDGKTTADGLFCGTIVHVAVKLGKRTHRCHFHCFPYWRHRRVVVLAEMFLNIFVFRTVQLLLKVSEITGKQIAVLCQCRFHKPEGTMPFCKNANHSGSDGDLNLLDGGKEEDAQLFIKTIEAYYLRESGTGLECVLLSVCFHQSPIACQAEIADGVECIPGFFIILYKKPPLLKNVYLLLKREQLLRISHNRINKKCPALVRCIPCGREAVAGSIGCKVTTLNRNLQIFKRKSA